MITLLILLVVAVLLILPGAAVEVSIELDARRSKRLRAEMLAERAE